MIYKLKQIGNDLYVKLSSELLKEIGIDEKTDIEMIVSNGELVIKPKRDIMSHDKRKDDMNKIADYLLAKHGPLLERLVKN
jgi:antitoxin component of MazEF toxin-antitoxin module